MTADIIVMGTSMGGLDALQRLLGGLVERFPVPVVVVQHRSRNSKGELVQILQKCTSIEVTEAEDRTELKAENIYVAPADYHLLVEFGYLGLSLESHINFARPSVDILFESASYSYRSGVIAVVLTGANSDGAYGVQLVKQAGGIVVVQDPADCVCDAMSLSAMAMVTPDYVLNLDGIADCLNSCSRRGV